MGNLRSCSVGAMVIACLLFVAPAETVEKEAPTVGATDTIAIGKYGFRHDPMAWVEADTSLQAALVRTRVFYKPIAGDAQRVEAHFAEIFAKQAQDGSLEDRHNQGVLAATGQTLLELLEMGCPPDRPEMQRTIDAIRRAVDELDGDAQSDMSCYALRALCELGITDSRAVSASLLKTAAEVESNWGGGCPWTPFVQLNALWAGRDLADLQSEIESTLAWAETAVSPSACSKALGLCEIASIIQMVGVVDHPAAERIASKIVPALLRMQEPDGGWGKGKDGDIRSLRIFALLQKYGLLEELRELPPLLEDWRVVRSIPAPGEKPKNIAMADGHLWVLDAGTWQAIAVSPADGSVLVSVQIRKPPGLTHFGFAPSNDVFYMTAHSKKGAGTDRVFAVDRTSGEVRQQIALPTRGDATGTARVGDRLIVADGWGGGVWVVDLEAPDKEAVRIQLASSMPDYLTASGNEIWGVDWFAPVMVRTNMNGDLLDWAERPFGFNPIAWDGQDLWVLDTSNRRLHLIERNTSR